jgi:hypothetical protein
MKFRNPSVTVHCTQCDYKARRQLADASACRGHHATPCAVGYCPNGHGVLSRADGGQVGDLFWSPNHPRAAFMRARIREREEGSAALREKQQREAERKARFLRGRLVERG